jgi:hypothetical protein
MLIVGLLATLSTLYHRYILDFWHDNALLVSSLPLEW